ncbi:MAG: hypothetical protein ACTSWJ_12070 [Candidatus Heimdallarchaeaceae archaeon]
MTWQKKASTMAVETVSIRNSEDVLGTFISPQDLTQILSPALRKQSIVRSYFTQADEDRTNRIMAFINSIANIFFEYYPSKIITEIVIQFQRLLPEFLEDYGENRYFTKKHAANHYLALLDYRLNMVGTKLSPKHVDLVRSLLGIKKSKIFSYFSVKKVQADLLTSGYLQRKKREVFSPMLKNLVSQIVNEFILVYPKLEMDLESLQKMAYELIDEKIIPRINIEESALVIVSSLLPFFLSERGLMGSFWLIIKDQYHIELEYLKRKVYRYRSLLKKSDFVNELGLGLNNFVEEKSEEYGFSVVTEFV